MTRLDRRSDSQANAEAIVRRESAYLGEHYASRSPRMRPRGLIELLHWYEAEWHDQAPDELHRFVVWFEYVSAQEVWRRRGGGSHLGSLAWSDGMRRLLESPRAQDPDGFYLLPLAAALATIERRDAYMAAFLRAIALAGFQVPTRRIKLGTVTYAALPESVAMVYASEALERLWRAYRAEAPARPLTGVVGERVSSRASDELSPADLRGRGLVPVPSDDQAARAIAIPSDAA